MFKVLLSVCFLALIAVSVSARQARINQGKEPKDTEVKDYAQVFVFYEQQWIVCGGIYYKEKWVLTAKSCVNDWKEIYSNITVVLPGVKTPFRGTKMFINTPIAGADTFYNEDYALIYAPTMVLPTTPPPKNAVATMNFAMDDFSADLTFAPNKLFKICGFGATQNSPNYPLSKLRCANATVVPITKCMNDANPALMVPTAGVICIAPNNDGNTCAGDYGGALYEYNVATGAKVYGILSYSPNIKKPSTCTDSHNTIVTIATMAMQTWITATIAANP